MTGPKNTIFEELADEDEESCLQEELLPQVLDGQSTSFHCNAELEVPGLAAPLNPGSQFSSSQDLTLSSEESPQPSLQCIGRISQLLFGRRNNHPSK
jgi:hypothetical protein